MRSGRSQAPSEHEFIRPVIFVSKFSLQLSSSKTNVMNHDDESFLSAYIDGELAGDQQQRVESAPLRTRILRAAAWALAGA